MSAKDATLWQLTSNLWLFEQATKDFTEQDAKFQPFPGGNHLNWILMHLATAEDGIISRITGEPKRFSEQLHKDYAGGSACRADDGMTQAEAWKNFTEMRHRTVEFIKSFPEQRYADKAPTGMPEMFPTIASAIGLLGAHPFWHFGQLSVNRRMLGKPNLFGG